MFKFNYETMYPPFSRFSILVVAIFATFLFLVPPNIASAAEPWLGVGLAYGSYDKADIEALGNPWVWNWGVGDTYMSNHTYHNNPDVDFPGDYVPMVYNCDLTPTTGVVDEALKWVEDNNYAGPMLIFNEPDTQTYDSCSKNGGTDWDLTNAVNAVDYIVGWRDEYYEETGNYVELILGGAYYSPTWYGFNWFSLFKSKWVAMKGTSWPDVQGMHFHLYHKLYDYTSSTSATTITNHFKDNMEATGGWNDLIDNNPEFTGSNDEVWITEVGVLDSDVAISTNDDVMDIMLPYLKANSRLDRVAWYSHSYSEWYQGFAKTALVNKITGAKNPAYYVFQDYCVNEGYCGDDPIDVDVYDSSVSNNYITNTFNGDDAQDGVCAVGEWCTWENTSNSDVFIQSNGDLVLRADPGTGYEACWLQWLNTATANGETYNLKADFNSTFDSGKSFFQIQTWDKINYLPFNSTWYTTGTNSIDEDITVYGAFGGRLAIKFCTYGTGTLTERKTATLQNISVTKVSDAGVSVKDTSVAGNMVTNDVQWDNSLVYDKWFRWYRDNNSTTNTSNISSGKFVLGTPGTSGNYGSCWIQWLSGAYSDGSTYRLKGTLDTTYGNGKASLQIQTVYNSAYKYFGVNTGTDKTVDQTFTVPNGGVGAAPFAVKFCTWGTNTATAQTTLKKISLEKL